MEVAAGFDLAAVKEILLDLNVATYRFDEIIRMPGHFSLEDIEVQASPTDQSENLVEWVMCAFSQIKNIKGYNLGDECIEVLGCREVDIETNKLNGFWEPTIPPGGGTQINLRGVLDIAWNRFIRVVGNTLSGSLAGIDITGDNIIIRDNAVRLPYYVAGGRTGVSVIKLDDSHIPSSILISGNRMDGCYYGVAISDGEELIVENNLVSGAYTAFRITTAKATGTRVRNNTALDCTVPITDAGTDTLFDINPISDTFDLSGGAADVIIFPAALGPHYLCGYTVVYSEASSADAGVNIRIGRLQADGTFDDDYYDIVASEVSKAKGYSIRYKTGDLIQKAIATGESVTVGTAGGKAGAGEVKVILHIAEL